MDLQKRIVKESKDCEGKINAMSNNKKDPLAWEEISTEHIVQDEWIDFRRSAYRFPDGSVFEPYYSYSRRDYVVIVATDTDGNYLCVRQYRHGIKEVTTEFVAGGIERKDGKEYGKSEDDFSEVALDAAKRELMEETGYTSNDWEYLSKVPSNATIADNYAYLFVAKNCTKVSGQDLDETEFLNVVKHSKEDIEKMIANEEFYQAMHIVAWYMSQQK
jgi:ADP-ribose pyrophosphatase